MTTTNKSGIIITELASGAITVRFDSILHLAIIAGYPAPPGITSDTFSIAELERRKQVIFDFIRSEWGMEERGVQEGWGEGWGAGPRRLSRALMLPKYIAHIGDRVTHAKYKDMGEGTVTMIRTYKSDHLDPRTGRQKEPQVTVRWDVWIGARTRNMHARESATYPEYRLRKVEEETINVSPNPPDDPDNLDYDRGSSVCS